MKNHVNLTKLLTGILVILFLNAVSFLQVLGQTREISFYKLKPVYLPAPVRPEVRYSFDQLKFKNASGVLPTYDGEQFQINLTGQTIDTADRARQLISQFLKSLDSPLIIDKDLRLKIDAITVKANQDYINEQIKAGQDETKRRLSQEFKVVSPASDEMLNELSQDVRKQAGVRFQIYGFSQYSGDILIDNTGLNVTNRTGEEMISLQGNFYNTVNVTNKKKLAASEALSVAIVQLGKENKYDSITGNPKQAVMVLLPYAEGFKNAWKTEITAEGPYEVWIDAESGKVLQLLPRFYYDNGRGLAFNPSPTEGTREMSFEVDPPSRGKYKLNLNGVLTLTNNGADGTTGIVEVNDDGSGTANFNVPPINGTVVERTNQTNYNGLFQQVNVFAHIYFERTLYVALGSENFSQINASLNNPGGNSFCCPPKYHIGDATTSNSTFCGSCNENVAVFNGAIDATVIAHEFGHLLNAIQYHVGGGTITGAVHEGLADYWACTNFNTDIFGGYWGHNCSSPTQSGWVPRQAEPTDIFPDRNSASTCASFEVHSAGQILCWANWDARNRMNELMSFGALSLNFNLIRAMTTAGHSVTDGEYASYIYISYRDLLRQLVTLYRDSRLVHKLLAGYARAGIFLSPADAIIDINDSYLDRSSAASPQFTIWTGEDFRFIGTNVTSTGTLPFNTQFLIEVANDEAFTLNLVNSGWLGGVVSAAGGTASWTLPAASWNTLKAGDYLFYRVTTRDGSGGNERRSWQPGNNFVGHDVPVGKAAINGTGAMDCTCSASGAPVNSAMALIPIIPLGLLIFFRKKKN
jgi:hypothetical protein